MQPKSLTDTDISSAIKSAITDAVAYIDSEIGPDRIRADKYFRGETTIDHEEGRSKVVATKCRDTVRAIKPALMRVFLQSGDPVEFSPTRKDAILDAQTRTAFARRIFEENNGFMRLNDAFHDALIKKTGILKVYYDETQEFEYDEYSQITIEQAQFVAAQQGVEVFEVKQDAETGLVYLKVGKTSESGCIKIDSIAPEDFFIDRGAVSLDNCFVCGHSTAARVGDLVELGFDFDQIYRLADGDGETDMSGELAQRLDGSIDGQDDSPNDPSMRKILFTEAYMRIDVDGTGVPVLHKFLCAGTSYDVIDYELADQVPFAVFEVDPEPHTFFGRSLVEIIEQDQDASTALLRGLIDNVGMMNNPRLVVNDAMVVMDDLMNGEQGAIVRAEDVNAVREMVVGSAASTALPAISYFDEAIRGKTGVSGAGQGLDADALQSQTAAGVNAAVQAATAVGELIARTLAESGMKQLFRLIVRLAAQHPKPDEMVRVDGQYIPVDPTSWGTDLSMLVNIGLGNNQRDEKIIALNQMQQFQMQILGTMGLGNGLVGLSGLRNTMADLLKISGLNDADRYMIPLTLEMEQQMMQQAAQQAGQGAQAPDPGAALAQAEMGKAKIRAQVDMQKAAAANSIKVADMMRNDDLQRDKMAQDLALGAAKIAGQYGSTVDTAQIRAAQQAPRSAEGGVSNG